jgi:hypothetical protein
LENRKPWNLGKMISRHWLKSLKTPNAHFQALKNTEKLVIWEAHFQALKTLKIGFFCLDAWKVLKFWYSSHNSFFP